MSTHRDRRQAESVGVVGNKMSLRATVMCLTHTLTEKIAPRTSLRLCPPEMLNLVLDKISECWATEVARGSSIQDQHHQLRIWPRALNPPLHPL